MGSINSGTGHCRGSVDASDFVIMEAAMWFFRQRFPNCRRGSSSLMGLFGGLAFGDECSI